MKKFLIYSFIVSILFLAMAIGHSYYKRMKMNQTPKQEQQSQQVQNAQPQNGELPPTPVEKTQEQIQAEIAAREQKEREEIAKSIKDLDKKIKKRPNADLYRKRGEYKIRAIVSNKDLSYAKDMTEDLVKATEGDNQDWKTPLWIAMGYSIQENYYQAILYLNKSIAIKPSAQAYMSLSDIKLKMEKYDEALKDLDKSEEISKSSNFEQVEINYDNAEVRKYAYQITPRLYRYKRRKLQRIQQALKEMEKRNQ